MPSINRRDFIKSAAATTALAATGIHTMAKNNLDNLPASKPNILFLYGEQHHPKVLSPAGHPIVQTPNLQRLANEGVYFKNAYCPTPLCVPSRTSTLTGRFSHATKITTNLYDDLIGDQPNLARSLRSGGYHTCHIGKTHLATGSSSSRRLNQLGFIDEFSTSGKGGVAFAGGNGHYGRYLKNKGVYDKFAADYEARGQLRNTTLCDAHRSVLDVEDYHDQWISRTADNWLRDYNDQKPFYLAVNWAGPHAFRDPPGQYADMYDPKQMDPPIQDPMILTPKLIKQRQSKTLAKLQDDCWRQLRASYYGMISLIDDGIGMMMQTLEKRGLLDNTIVIYTADHGEMLCDHGLVYKTLMYESSAAIPLILRYPKVFKINLQPDSLASTIDLAPTLLELAGAPALPNPHGQSLVPILTGAADNRSDVFCEFQQTCMIRHNQWKYIRDPQWNIQQLFNLDEDPSELNNLINNAPDIARQLNEQITKWLQQTT